MIFSRSVRHHSGGLNRFVHIKHDKSKSQLSGFAFGESIRLQDELGKLWIGIVSEGDGDQSRCSLRDEDGKTLSGVVTDRLITLRDDAGTYWRGFID